MPDHKSTKVLLFGDQTEKVLPIIKDLYIHAQSSQFLQHFLQVSSDAARRSFEALPSHRRSACHFDSIVSLAEESARRQCPDVVVQTLLLCIAQLGTLVKELEHDATLLQDTVVVGWCTGLLPAAIAAASHSMVQVLQAVPDAIGMSIDIGVEAFRQAELIESGDESWARVIGNCSEETLQLILNKFNSDNGISPVKAAYISATAPSFCTVSGPPSTLKALSSCGELYKTPFSDVPIQIAAPFHAEHLPRASPRNIFTEENIEIFKTLGTVEYGTIISSSTGKPYKATELQVLLPQILDDIFQTQIHQHDVFGYIRNTCRNSTVRITPIVASSLCRRLDTYLAESGIATTRKSETDTAQSTPNQRSIAIVGMSGRFPGAESLEEFWDVLESGMDLHREIPADRFDIKTHHDQTGKRDNTTLSPFGCFIDRPGFFDARLFNMSPREAASTDPGQRILLMTTYEALEMAGYSQDPNENERDTKVGTFFGQTIDDWREYNAAENVDMYYVTGGIRAFSAGRVNYHFKWDGPSYSVDSACSSSLLAIQLAYNSLLNRECNMAVAGGSNILTGCNMYSGLSRGSFLSQTGSCKTFDSSADGYCRGEGVGVVILKRLEDAVASRDPILAVIQSAATNHSAKAVSITHPHVETQERLFRDVLVQAGVEPGEVDYVECHGTGTQAGDAAESSSTVNVLTRCPRKRPLVIGSIKPNIGHGEAAAGVSSLIKSLMMLKKERFLPHVGVKERLNPKLPLFTENKYEIATSNPFSRDSLKSRKVLVNNFSAAGGNTSILIEEGPSELRKTESADPRTAHVVAVSGKTPASLKQNLQRLCDYLAQTSSSIADIAYTTTARRLHHPLRRAYSVKTVADCRLVLEKDRPNWEIANTSGKKRQNIVFTFPGQGSKITGVAASLYESSLAFRQIISELDALSTAQGLSSLLPTLLGINPSPSPLEKQVCLVLVEVALARLWQSWGVHPSLVIGHSLGEYAALCVAGVVSAADMIFLVSKRASLMQNSCAIGVHTMLSLQMSPDDLVNKIHQQGNKFASIEVACINGPTSTVVSGLRDQITALQHQIQAEGGSAILLDVPYSFHSAQMDPILEPYESAARSVHFVRPVVPVASTLLGSVVKDSGVFSASYLARQARQPVRYFDALNYCSAENLVDNKTLYFEMGPGTTGLSFVRQTLGCRPDQNLATLELMKEPCETISSTMASAYTSGVDVRWTEFHRCYTKSLSVVDLPSYAFDLKNYWLDYTSRLDQALTATSVSNNSRETPTFGSACWQYVEEEAFGPSEAHVTFRSDLSHPELSAMVRGHAVGGIGLCPSSVYASMAFSCALYIFQHREGSPIAIPPMDISGMEIFSPCIITGDSEPHTFKVEATQQSPSDPIQLIFSSCRDANSYCQHARCTVVRGDVSMFRGANQSLYLIRGRIDALQRKEKEGEIDRLSKRMVYKLFKTVVDYSEPFQAMNYLHLNPERPESFARFSFSTPQDTEHYVHSPFWIDNLAQLGGFSLNVSPPSGEDDVYISHGWQSMRMLRRLSQSDQYTAYVCMQPSIDGHQVWSGDVYVFNDDEVVAMCSGLKFKQMRRSLLHGLLRAAVPVSVASTPSSKSRSRSNSTSRGRHGTETPLTEHSFTTSLPNMEQTVFGVIKNAAGLNSGDLSEDSAEWSGLGIDSLLTITILQQLRESTGIDLPSSLFTSYPTVQSLRAYCKDQAGHQNPSSASSREPSTRPIGRQSANQNPSRAESRQRPAASNRSVSLLKRPIRSRSSTWASNKSNDSAISMSYDPKPESSYEILASIISREVGISRDDLSPFMPLSDLGIDSLLTITILSLFREETGVSLPSSFFNDHPTLDTIKPTLQPPEHKQTIAQHDRVDGMRHQRLQDVMDPPSQSTSVPLLLQGSRSHCQQSLFLLPDGSGSALSYIDLPPLTSRTTSLPVYALNSPFVQNPDDYTLAFEDVAEIFIKAIRKLQPHGPYLLAGWSMGGIFAYEVSRRLLDAGEAVDLLCLIDSPCPRTLPPLPAPTLDILDKAGIFSGLDKAGKGVSTSTRKHFLASVRTLEHYYPVETPLDAKLGKVVVIWARDGVLERVGDEEKKKAVLSDDEIAGEARNWLVGNRRDFGPAGWDKLVGKGVECVCVAGDHFSIVKAPQIDDVQAVLTRSLQDAGFS